MRLLVAGEGASARRHLAALRRIDGVDIVLLVGGDAEATERLARDESIPDWSLDLAEGLNRGDVEAVVLATPTPLHANQATQSLRAGKHTLVEIPMADNLADAQALAAVAADADPVAMVCHTRRFNPSHRWIHERVAEGQLRLRHLVVETLFLRRENRNALGEPRDWADHLLWHHACHTVDLFRYQTGEEVTDAWAVQGPHHRKLGIAMDMSIGLASDSGALCTLALSFNNDGPLGTTFRYICDEGTYVARYDDLVTGHHEQVDVSSAAVAPGSGAHVTFDGIELQDREFLVAIEQRREPNASVTQALPTMQTLDRLARLLEPDPSAATS